MRTGRPKTKIDLEQAEKLGALQCTVKECSAFLGVAEGTLKNRQDFQALFKKGLEVGKISLRRLQFRLAERSAAMAIWLGKQYLDQKDKFEISPQDAFKGKIEILPDEPMQLTDNRVKDFIN